jgi:hypothetical protein
MQRNAQGSTHFLQKMGSPLGYPKDALSALIELKFLKNVFVLSNLSMLIAFVSTLCEGWSGHRASPRVPLRAIHHAA